MAGAGWCGMVMTDAKTPPVAFCPVWAYSFSYGQDSGVSSGRDLPTATLHPDRCEVMLTPDGWCQSDEYGVLRTIDGSFLAKTVCGGQQREISIASALKNRLPPGQVTGLWLPPPQTVTTP
jgi:hypothetical protein